MYLLAAYNNLPPPLPDPGEDYGQSVLPPVSTDHKHVRYSFDVSPKFRLDIPIPAKSAPKNFCPVPSEVTRAASTLAKVKSMRCIDVMLFN